MQRPATALAIVLGVALAAPPVPAQAARPVTAPTATSVRSATEAATLLRTFFFTHDFDDGATLGADLARRFPSDMRVRTWYIASLMNVGLDTRADSITAHTDSLARDPWALAARSLARLHALPATTTNFNAARRLAARALSLAPRDSDLAWLGAFALVGTPGFPMRGFDREIVYIDSIAPKVGNPASLRLLRADALISASTGAAVITSNGQPPVDTAKRNAAFREYAALIAEDSADFGALYSFAAKISASREDSALVLIRRAVALAPRAVQPRQQLWTLINRQRTLSAIQRREMIAADRDAFLVSTDRAPWALAAVASSMRAPPADPTLGKIEDEILEKAPRSQWAETVLLRRATQWRDSIIVARDTARPGPKSDTAAMRHRFVEAMEAFVSKPWVANPTVHGQAVEALFNAARTDPAYPTDRLVALVKEVVAAPSGASPEVRYGLAARALADHHVEPALSEKLARQGLKQVPEYMAELPDQVLMPVGDRADLLDHAEASLHDAVGWALYGAGRYAAADSEITRALDLDMKNVEIFHDLGRLRIAQGRSDDAELAFAQGMTVRYRGVNPNLSELESIYRTNHVSMDGWNSYLGALTEKERATRRARILATRDTSAKVVPPFRLADLTGKVVDSDTLRNRIVIVNFWGTWCGPCVAEMPELQQFYDKYRNDPSVAILTISNDKDLAELKAWVAARHLTIPALFDDGYVGGRAQVGVFPTTWFLAPGGRTSFVAAGNTGALVEEWTWRIEAMRTKPAPIVP